MVNRPSGAIIHPRQLSVHSWMDSPVRILGKLGNLYTISNTLTDEDDFLGRCSHQPCSPCTMELTHSKVQVEDSRWRSVSKAS